jgi:MerR family transcriptional regulator, thiopeptide resistance regulator
MKKDTFVSILRAAGVTEAQMNALHAAFERLAPEDHHKFLEFLSIDQAEIAQIREASRKG